MKARFAAALLAATLCAVSLFAQSERGTISGTVRDASVGLKGILIYAGDCKGCAGSRRLADSYFNLGLVLIKWQIWDEAVAVLQRAVGLRPKHAEAHYSLKRLAGASGRDEASGARAGQPTASR